MVQWYGPLSGLFIVMYFYLRIMFALALDWPSLWDVLSTCHKGNWGLNVFFVSNTIVFFRFEPCKLTDTVIKWMRFLGTFCYFLIPKLRTKAIKIGKKKNKSHFVEICNTEFYTYYIYFSLGFVFTGKIF